MNHYIWTRIAHETATINPKLPPRGEAAHRAAIKLWLKHSRRFYEHQTADVPFRVVLTYDEPLAGLVRGHDWPDYATLTTQDIGGWLIDNVPLHQPATVTRCDCDDSYTTDWLEMLEQRFTGAPERVNLLYHWMRQFNTTTGELTRPIWHKCPQFSTIYFPAFPHLTRERIARHVPGNPLFGVLGNHGRFVDEPHEEADGCYALLRVTGFNAVNCWGTVGRGRVVPEVDPNPDPRFLP